MRYVEDGKMESKLEQKEKLFCHKKKLPFLSLFANNILLDHLHGIAKGKVEKHRALQTHSSAIALYKRKTVSGQTLESQNMEYTRGP